MFHVCTLNVQISRHNTSIILRFHLETHILCKISVELLKTIKTVATYHIFDYYYCNIIISSKLYGLCII